MVRFRLRTGHRSKLVTGGYLDTGFCLIFLFTGPLFLRMLWLAACVVAGELTTGAREGTIPQKDSPSAAANTDGVEHTDRGGAEGGKGGENRRKNGERKAAAATVIFCDGVSAPVPFLRLAGPVRPLSPRVPVARPHRPPWRETKFVA